VNFYFVFKVCKLAKGQCASSTARSLLNWAGKTAKLFNKRRVLKQNILHVLGKEGKHILNVCVWSKRLLASVCVRCVVVIDADVCVFTCGFII